MTTLPTPRREQFEYIRCYLCGSADSVPLVIAEDDLTGKPGRFLFVRCQDCELAYQNPRLKTRVDRRLLRRRVHRASQEDRLGPADAAVRMGDGKARPRQGGAGQSLRFPHGRSDTCSMLAVVPAPSWQRSHRHDRRRCQWRRFQGPLAPARVCSTSSFTWACFTSRPSRIAASTWSRCGISWSTTTTRCATLEPARANLLAPNGPAGDRSAAARQRLVPALQGTLARPAGAAAHGAVTAARRCSPCSNKPDWKWSSTCRMALSRRTSTSSPVPHSNCSKAAA